MNKFELKILSGFSGFKDAFDFSSLTALTDFSAIEAMEECVQTSPDYCREIFFTRVFKETDIAWKGDRL
jgi:hypothetical protein